MPSQSASGPPEFPQGVAGAGGALVAAAGNGNGVYRSADGGATWTRTLDVFFAWDLTGTADGAFWAGTSQGAYQSTDGGASWTQRSGGIPERAVYAVAETAGGAVLAGTGAGVYSADLVVAGEAGPAAAPRAALALRVFPSPVAAGASVTITLGAAAGPVRIDVVDALGRTVRTLAERDGAAGSLSVSTAGLAPGVYAVRAESGGARATRRLVVAR